MPKTSDEIGRILSDGYELTSKESTDNFINFLKQQWFSPAEVEEKKQEAISKFAGELIREIQDLKYICSDMGCNKIKKIRELIKSKSEVR